MKNKKTERVFNEESKFIQFETDRIYRKKRSQIRAGYFFLIVGLALLMFGFKMQVEEWIKPPIPGFLMLAGVCMTPSGLLVCIRMAFIKRDKIRKQLEHQFSSCNLSAKDFDEEMEQFGAFSLEKDIIITRNFIINREPIMTKALCIDEVYFVTGAFVAQNKNYSEVGHMLYNGKGAVEEHTKEGYSRVRGNYFIEFYDEEGNPIYNYKNTKFTVKTGNERKTKEILQDIHHSHPWIYMGREQKYCMSDDNVIEYKLLFDENKRRYLETV